MTKQTINVGTTANDKKGDSLRAAFQKVNANFTELYTALGLNADITLNLGAFEFTGSTMSTTDSTAIVIDQAVTVNSNLTVGGDVIPQTANGGDLGSAAKPWKSLYVSSNTIYIGGNSLGLDNEGELVWNNSRIAHADGEYITLDSLTDVNANSPNSGDTIVWNGGAWVNASLPTLTSQLTNDSGFLTTAVLNNGLDADLKGSVFADDSTIMVDGVSGVLRANVNVSNTWTVTTGDKTWSFIYGDIGEGTIPTLEFPGNLQSTGTQTSIFARTNDLSSNWGMSIDAGNSPYNVDIGDINGASYWRFSGDGSITFPDTTVQTTAFTTDPTLNVLRIDDGVHEKFQTKADATGTVQHNCALGHIFYHTSPDANWTANFTNINLESGYATAVTLIIVQGGTGYYPSAVQIGGVGQTLNWQGNTTPTPSTNRTDVVTFSIINNSGTYTVLGQLTGF